MRKIILSMAVTVDGFMEGPHGETDWAVMDDEMQFDTFLEQTDTILFGRKCYDKYLKKGPPATTNMEKGLWDAVFSKELVVFSYTLQEVIPPVRLVREDPVAAIQTLKKQPGNNIWVFGGASLASFLLNEGLLDEIQLGVIPVVLGAGKPLFTAIHQQIPLKTTHCKLYQSGIQTVYYEPVR